MTSRRAALLKVGAAAELCHLLGGFLGLGRDRGEEARRDDDAFRLLGAALQRPMLDEEVRPISSWASRLAVPFL